MLDIILIALSIAVALYASLRFVHMLQLESYQNPMYLKWLRRNVLRDWLPTILVFLICALCDAAFPLLLRAFTSDEGVLLAGQAAVRVVYLLLLGFIGFSWRKQPSKKPLVFTGRVKRLLVVEGVILVLSALPAVIFRGYYYEFAKYLFLRWSVYLPALLLPIYVWLASCVAMPIEEGIKKSYFNQAKNILANRHDLLKIGITGSYGKTTSKFVLGNILAEKFNVLITPHSYNTPMGITRVVREQLRTDNDVFVAEMGARYVGDIDELCELVQPSIGMLSSVGVQHLETFGSAENIANTKFELIANLPPDGAAFLNGDNEICVELSKRPMAVKEVFLYGIRSKEDLYMRAVDVAVGTQGSVFTLVSKDGKRIDCRTRLLGFHNILNITGGAAIAYYMGLTMEQIARGIRRLEPVEHRLQLINGPVTVIDDAFNANPDGAKAAMEVLRGFPGRRIVVTPGMVELGPEENELNREFGRQMAVSSDYALLIGEKRSMPLQEGLKEKGYDMDNVFVVTSLEQATAVLANLTRPGDVVLFENDLPDNYTE